MVEVVEACRVVRKIWIVEDSMWRSCRDMEQLQVIFSTGSQKVEQVSMSQTTSILCDEARSSAGTAARRRRRAEELSASGRRSVEMLLKRLDRFNPSDFKERL